MATDIIFEDDHITIQAGSKGITIITPPGTKFWNMDGPSPAHPDVKSFELIKQIEILTLNIRAIQQQFEDLKKFNNLK